MSGAVHWLEVCGAITLIGSGYRAMWLASGLWANRNGGLLTLSTVLAAWLYGLDMISNGAIFIYYWSVMPERDIPMLARLLFWPCKIGSAVGLHIFVTKILPILGATHR